MTPFDFLKLLWENKPADQLILIWTLQPKQSHWFCSIPQAADFLQTHHTDVYVGVGLSEQDYGPDRRCPSSEIAGIPGFWADLDVKSAAHPKDLPASIEVALTLIPASLPPTIIIATGNGVQAWWLFKEPWIFENEDERKEAATLSVRFQTHFQYNANQRGWAFERLSDLARVLRIPGTVNGKDPNEPKQVTVHSFGGRRYNPSEFEDYLDDLAIPDPEAEQSAATDWKERFADNPITINLGARIPQEMIDRWCEANVRFKSTWLRQRHDMPDQSQSGYDMALADFGVAQDLDEQQIVDLIIHHHFIHRKRHRTGVDYYQRTISKAAKHFDSAAIPKTKVVAPPGTTDGVSAYPLIAKAQAWERVSGVLGIRIFRVVKITGKDPIYRMDMEGAKVEFSNVKKLLSQEAFRYHLAAAANTLPSKLKPKVWQEIAQMMLSALTEEDGGEEMDIEGAARMHISRYLAETGFIDSVAGQNSQNSRKPMILDRAITVCSSDIQLYVNKTTAQNLSIAAITAMLSVLGAGSFRHRGKFSEQSRWRLPSSEFDPGEYSAQYREDMDHGAQ